MPSLLPRGFHAAAACAGLKPSGKPDLALWFSEIPAPFAALTTTHLLRGPSAEHTLQAVRKGKLLQAILVNSGNSNTLTGRQGQKDHARVLKAVARRWKIAEENVLFHSTGIMGVPLPVGKILKALPELLKNMGPKEAEKAARAILTTDKNIKIFSETVRTPRGSFRLTAVAKGAGMIHPKLATMLVYLFTDAAAPRSVLTAELKNAAAGTFQTLTVDGDTSPSDTVVLWANGAASLALQGGVRKRFCTLLNEACRNIARAIARDGEGATKLVEITVEGARNPLIAQQAARAVASSLLVKTALWGGDPNWGRVLSAVGAAGIPCRQERVRLWIEKTLVFNRGKVSPFSKSTLRKKLSGKDVSIRMHLGEGLCKASAFTCDLSPAYVTFNGRYTT